MDSSHEALMRIVQDDTAYPNLSRKMRSENDWHVFSTFLFFHCWREPDTESVRHIADAAEKVLVEYERGARTIELRRKQGSKCPILTLAEYRTFEPVQSFQRRFLGHVQSCTSYGDELVIIWKDDRVAA